MDCHFLLQGIFPTQELNLGLLHCRQTLYRLSHQGFSLGICLCSLMNCRFSICAYCRVCISSVQSLSRVRLFATPWTVAYQAPPSMGFSRQECWSGLPFPSPGDLPDPEIESMSSALAGGFFATELPGKPKLTHCCMSIISQ